MPGTHTPGNARRMLRVFPQSGTVLAIFALVLPPLAVLSSNAVVPLLLIAALLACLGAWLESRRLLWPPLTIIILFGMLLLWAAVASFWSFDVQEALVLAVRLGILVLAGLVLFAVVQTRTPDERRQIARWLLLGYCLGILVFFVEYLFDFPIHRFANQLDPSDNVPLSRLNRGATSLAMLVWPVAAAIFPRPRHRWLLALPVCIVPVIVLSESAAAQAGLLTGCAFAALSQLHKDLGRRLILFAVIFGFATGPIIAKQLYENGFHELDILASNAQARVYIWNFVADRIAEKPIVGWGFDASRHMPNFGSLSFRQSIAKVEDIRPLSPSAGDVIPLHPHNAVLQVWLELGAVGAVLGLLIVVLIWTRIGSWPCVPRIAADGLFVTTVVIACASYGLWQNKWVSTMFAVAALMPLCREVSSSSRSRQAYTKER